MGPTKQLAAYVSQLKYSDIPAPVVEKVKECLLDYAGCTLFAAQTDMGKYITAYGTADNSGVSSILPEGKAKYNSTMAALRLTVPCVTALSWTTPWQWRSAIPVPP